MQSELNILLELLEKDVKQHGVRALSNELLIELINKSYDQAAMQQARIEAEVEPWND